jgi:rhamnose utilization protein RhaD (predicted bifunctional aldolase and dehydrogenase)
MTSSPIDDWEFHALRKLSAALGADPLRTQGAGGNTSINETASCGSRRREPGWPTRLRKIS